MQVRIPASLIRWRPVRGAIRNRVANCFALSVDQFGSSRELTRVCDGHSQRIGNSCALGRIAAGTVVTGQFAILEIELTLVVTLFRQCLKFWQSEADRCTAENRF